MKKFLGLIVIIAIAAVITTQFTGVDADAKSYNYMSDKEVKAAIENNTPMTLVDIQVEDEFAQHHIIDAVATYAYPVKSEADRAKMASSISALKGNNDLAVVVCPRGGGGAERAYKHLVASGIDEKRVFILTKGQAGWGYPELLEK